MLLLEDPNNLTMKLTAWATPKTDSNADADKTEIKSGRWSQNNSGGVFTLFVDLLITQ